MAYDTYTEALTIDAYNSFTNSRLSCNRATTLLKLGKFDEAIEDFSLAIEADETYVKAYQRRAKCYLESENYEEALKDAEKAFSMDRSRENHQLLKDAKLALAKSKRTDYYKVLGVPQTAGERMKSRKHTGNLPKCTILIVIQMPQMRREKNMRKNSR